MAAKETEANKHVVVQRFQQLFSFHQTFLFLILIEPPESLQIIFEDKEILKIIFNNSHLNNPDLYMWQQLVVMSREFLNNAEITKQRFHEDKTA